MLPDRDAAKAGTVLRCDLSARHWLRKLWISQAVVKGADDGPIV